MVIALSAALAAASVTHLAACGLGKSRLRYFTKLLLMPLVAALYCALVDRPAPAVLAAMFCGWVGDFFMIYKHKDAFLAAGMAAFGVGHILYVAHIGVIAAAAEPRLFTALAATLVPGAVAIVIFAVLRRRIPKQLRLARLRRVHRAARGRARRRLPARGRLPLPLLGRYPLLRDLPRRRQQRRRRGRHAHLHSRPDPAGHRLFHGLKHRARRLKKTPRAFLCRNCDRALSGAAASEAGRGGAHNGIDAERGIQLSRRGLQLHG